ncbi:MAG: bifunctional 5,10-methylenetetrahydrofolate dehydrogenase/5,10-methenyltetrahydrofolate cyclohydrolase [Candidatus Pacebacteria bacterium]|nr:bifunctional 5,10-methylenetetrahydrofolate dehydrogenase/5,10-methenyltetrahydrofolate cyclohydrolase [Candidatus Paceibacterota bacterium]
MVQIIDGKKIAESIKDKIAKEIYSFKGQRPNLAIVLVGDREDSKLYVNLKCKQAKGVGIDTHFYHLEENIKESELLEVINFLNQDDIIDGILVQLPLPKHLDADKIVNTISYKKDVDGFHKKSLERIDSEEVFLSPVFASVLKVLQEIKFNIEGKKVAIIHNSSIFGKSLAKLIANRKGEVVLVQKKEVENKKKNILQADVIITALGVPKYLDSSLVKPKAVVIDVGISKLDGKVVGDANFEDLKNIVSYITPVPGGIGPMTIAMLFKNTLQAFKNHRQK